MEEIREGFKIVRVLNFGVVNVSRQFISFLSDLPPEYTRHYAIGQVTFRPEGGGPLGVFQSEDLARSWLGRWTMHRRLFRCRYQPAPESHFFYTLPDGRAVVERCHPRGGDFAEWVELTEEIPWSKPEGGLL